MLGSSWQPVLLWLAAGVGIMVGASGEAVHRQVKNITKELLQAVPYNINDNVTTLVMEGNLITLNEADQHALESYPTLEELYLGSNRITTVPAKFFAGLRQLRVLSLARNNLIRLDRQAFSGLVCLKEVDLSHNELTNLPTQLITGLNNLQVLNLQENPWNCSCPLQRTITSMRSANITFGGSQMTCASPEEQRGSDLLQAAALCPSEAQKPKQAHKQQTQSSTIMLKTTLSSSQNDSKRTDQSPVLGNTWKFTACVAALALTTSTLIISAIKGPSWYKRFHNYRHQRLDHDEDWDGEDFVSTTFQQTEWHPTSESQCDPTEEKEDGDEYFEDPYFKQEEEEAGEGIQAGP